MTLFPIQFPTGKTMEDRPSTWAPAIPGFSLAQPWLLWTFGNEPVDRRFFSSPPLLAYVFLFLSNKLPHSCLQRQLLEVNNLVSLRGQWWWQKRTAARILKTNCMGPERICATSSAFSEQPLSTSHQTLCPHPGWPTHLSP